MKKFLLSIIIIYTAAIAGIAQPLSTLPYDMMIEAAEEQFELGEYFNAIEW